LIDLACASAGMSDEQMRDQAPLDVPFAGVTEAAAAASVIQPYAKAGATWWLEGIWVERGSAKSLQERIQHGPPSVDLTHAPD
jgi:hypothetical protein